MTKTKGSDLHIDKMCNSSSLLWIKNGLKAAVTKTFLFLFE